jgi:hypothetical protein
VEQAVIVTPTNQLKQKHLVFAMVHEDGTGTGRKDRLWRIEAPHGTFGLKRAVLLRGNPPNPPKFFCQHWRQEEQPVFKPQLKSVHFVGVDSNVAPEVCWWSTHVRKTPREPKKQRKCPFSPSQNRTLTRKHLHLAAESMAFCEISFNPRSAIQNLYLIYSILVG